MVLYIKSTEEKIMKNMKARVSEPNTPETDSQEFVLHTVTYTDDNEEISVVEVLATDPMDAINHAKYFIKNKEKNNA